MLFLVWIFCLKSAETNIKYNTAPSPEFSRCYELPLTDIAPDSWLRNFLVVQKDGLTGHINAAGYPYNSIGWKGVVGLPKNTPKSKVWWPYEQTAYWIDGALRCGYLLHDTKFTDSVKSNITYVLDHPNLTGVLGPRNFGNNRWPNAIIFRAMMAVYYATGDAAIIDRMIKHFMATKDEYSTERNIINIETMCWLYGVSGNKNLLDMAVKSYDIYNMQSNTDETLKNLLSNETPTDHGVTFIESIKIPAILYTYTGEKKYLEAALKGFEKLDRFHMLIDGVPSSSENLNGKRSNNVHETCDISDYIWSAGYLLMATGDPNWADRMEKAAYNAGPGAVTKSFKEHQYYSGPNQFTADENSSKWNSIENWFEQSRSRMAYRPFFDTECCTGNVNRFMPNLISRMWLTDSAGGIFAAILGPATVTTVAGPKRKKYQLRKVQTIHLVQKLNLYFNVIM